MDTIVGEDVLTRRRILVADDSVVNQQIAVLQLEKLGYHADVAADGNAVLLALETTVYDLILMDCQMPHLNGFQATEEIRRRERDASHMLIIAVTASSAETDPDICRAAGMDDYLQKPIRIADLEKLLTRIFAQRSA